MPVYLLRPLSGDASRGENEFVNAILLRRGYALLDLSDPSQPLFDALAESQRVALSQFDDRSAAGDSVWYHYPMAFPRERLSQRPRP